MRLLKNTSYSPREAAIAQVGYSSETDFNLVGRSAYRGVPVFAPRGFSYQPVEGDNILLLPADGQEVCAGVLCKPILPPGELELFSAGGAKIQLKNNGDITLNGVTITKAGEIIPLNP